jgi:hypothetical protein
VYCNLCCSIYVCVIAFVCTSVRLLPLGENPIAVSNNNNISVAVVYSCFETAYQSHLKDPENGKTRPSQNVGKQLQMQAV